MFRSDAFLNRIRELCARVVQSDGGPEFETAIMELANPLDIYLSIEDAKGWKSAGAKLIA
jgi:hypothetical protein